MSLKIPFVMKSLALVAVGLSLSGCVVYPAVGYRAVAPAYDPYPVTAPYVAGPFVAAPFVAPYAYGPDIFVGGCCYGRPEWRGGGDWNRGGRDYGRGRR